MNEANLTLIRVQLTPQLRRAKHTLIISFEWATETKKPGSGIVHERKIMCEGISSRRSYKISSRY